MQVCSVLYTFHKYYEYKDFVELLQFKKAVYSAKESYNSAMIRYRAALNRPGQLIVPEEKQDLLNYKEYLADSHLPSQARKANNASASNERSGHKLIKTWYVLFFVGLMLIIFGGMLDN